MLEKDVYLSRQGFEELQDELNHLRDVKRKEIDELLRQALEEGGNLLDNTAYLDAKEQEAFTEARIEQLETLLSRAHILDDPPHDKQAGTIQLRSQVMVQETAEAPEIYSLVSSAEADPRQGRLSSESPLGRALIGKRAGDVVRVAAPDGELIYRILDVQPCTEEKNR